MTNFEHSQQETGSEISKRIFSGCGMRELGRQRRSLPPMALFNSNADLFIDDEDESSNNERFRRAADPGAQENRSSNRGNNQEIKVEPYKFPRNENYASNRGNNNRGRNSNNNSRNNQRGSYTSSKADNSRDNGLDKLVKEIRQKVKDTKKFWSNLPYVSCSNNEDFATASNSDNCWNGQSVNR